MFALVCGRRRKRASRVPVSISMSRTRTSTVPDRVRLLRASSEYERLRVHAALRTWLSQSRTSARRPPLLARATTFLIAREKETSRKPRARDRSQKFHRQIPALHNELLEFHENVASASTPMPLRRQKQVLITK